jgi:hypothetical protein
MPADDLQDAPAAPGGAEPIGSAGVDAGPDAAADAARPEGEPGAASAPVTSGPAAPEAAAPDPEPEAWARVVASWDDEAVHGAYLARFGDLEGLAIAGGRYRAVLDARPDDPVARRFRDEVVKRATVAGLAQLPRTRPRSPIARPVQVLLVALLLAALVVSILFLWRGVDRLLPDLK